MKLWLLLYCCTWVCQMEAMRSNTVKIPHQISIASLTPFPFSHWPCSHVVHCCLSSFATCCSFVPNRIRSILEQGLFRFGGILLQECGNNLLDAVTCRVAIRRVGLGLTTASLYGSSPHIIIIGIILTHICHLMHQLGECFGDIIVILDWSRVIVLYRVG